MVSLPNTGMQVRVAVRRQPVDHRPVRRQQVGHPLVHHREIN
jgi:hypothetical protein